MQDLVANILPLVVLFGVFYVLLILPQQRQQKKHQQMITELKKGDKIITAGGLHAEIEQAEEETFLIRLSKDSTARITKASVAQKIEK